MSERSNRAYLDSQFDMFLPYLSDLPLRDQREMMERPFFSLAKSKRLKPIEYRSPDGKVWVHVSANPNYGMATIWDADILIYCASMISDMKRRGVNHIPQTLHVMPYDLLRAIGRPTTGRAYDLLGQALDRLQSTTVKTNIRAQLRREATFSWLDGWTQLVDERTERSRGMSLNLSGWFYDGLMMDGGVLSIDRAYFDITGGRERWLYKVARKHAGGAGEEGFSISLPTLFEKSGADGLYRRFKFEIAAIARRNALPGYGLEWEERSERREPALRMIRRDATAPTRKPDSSAKPSPHRASTPAPAGPKESDVRAPSSATLSLLREECPGWDYEHLQDRFDEWLAADPSRAPANYDAAYRGFVRSYHERNKHSLNLF
jgi:plasmid replication initiation protein